MSLGIAILFRRTVAACGEDRFGTRWKRIDRRV